MGKEQIHLEVSRKEISEQAKIGDFPSFSFMMKKKKGWTKVVNEASESFDVALGSNAYFQKVARGKWEVYYMDVIKSVIFAATYIPAANETRFDGEFHKNLLELGMAFRKDLNRDFIVYKEGVTNLRWRIDEMGCLLTNTPEKRATQIETSIQPGFISISAEFRRGITSSEAASVVLAYLMIDGELLCKNFTVNVAAGHRLGTPDRIEIIVKPNIPLKEMLKTIRDEGLIHAAGLLVAEKLEASNFVTRAMYYNGKEAVTLPL